MLTLIKEIFSLLTSNQKHRYYSLQIMVLFMAFAELFGIASIGPFMALVADINLLQTNAFFNRLYVASGLSDPLEFLFLAGLTVLAMLALASVVSIVSTWRLSLFAYSVGTEIGDRLYQYYLNQNWLFHAASSSAQLTKKITNEARRVTEHIILPLMQMNARLVMTILIGTALLIYNPVVAAIGLLAFSSGYVIIYKVFRKRIAQYGKNISTASAKRFQLMNEGFGGIKDILLLDRSQSYVELFQDTGKTLARAQGVNSALGQVPRFFMELLAFGSMISLVLVLIKTYEGTLIQILPVLAVYALAGFKLLPALQQIYASFTTIRGGMAGFESIKPDLIASRQPPIIGARPSEVISLVGAKFIKFDDISFTYPNKKEAALDRVSINIAINSTVGFVGESGSGKSTAIDILLALIEPDQGHLMLDDLVIDQGNRKAWQKHIGFVPQSIFLTEGTIAENIAFGLRAKEIDLGKVKQAARLANLEELAASLPEGLDTRVGERGVQLSGGQRQRVGIARALYNETSILVFDEATSSLDGITEKVIMDAIHDLGGQKTIILIAHRLKTVQKCNVIYLFSRGRVIARGSYDELLEKNAYFWEMAKLA